MRRFDAEKLRHRSHLTPSECAFMHGRSARFWRRLFDDGAVEGTRLNGRRYLNHDSVRDFFVTESAAFAPPNGMVTLEQARAMKIDWKAAGL